MLISMQSEASLTSLLCLDSVRLDPATPACHRPARGMHHHQVSLTQSVLVAIHRSSRPSFLAETISGPSYPPASISIKGSGGPYRVVVGNVAKGTTAEDIRVSASHADVLFRKTPADMASCRAAHM